MLLVSVGYAVASLLIERSITGSVTIASQPDLYLLDSQGKPITVLDFGTLNNGAHLTAQCKIYNAGNTPLAITITRTDTTQINSVAKKTDGTTYDNLSPTTLNLGETLSLSIEIWNTINLAPGSYQLGFKVSGSS